MRRSVMLFVVSMLLTVAGFWAAAPATAVNGFIYPEITSPADGTVFECPAPDLLEVTVIVGGSGTVAAAVEVQVDDGPLYPANLVCATWYAEVPFPCCDLGLHLITAVATSVGGVTGSTTVMVEIVDTTPPTIACPPDVTTCVDCGSCGKRLGPWLGVATATDSCELVSLVNDAPAVFPIGNTLVTWQASDAAGGLAICGQWVTVRARAIFDPPITNRPFIGHWSPRGFTLRRYAILPIPFHLADCKGRMICCDYDDVALLISGPDWRGNTVACEFSLANGKLRRFCGDCCYEAVFDTRCEYPVRSGGRYTMTIEVNGLAVASMQFRVW